MFWVFLIFIVADALAWVLYILERKKSYIFMGVLLAVLWVAALICSVLLWRMSRGL